MVAAGASASPKAATFPCYGPFLTPNPRTLYFRGTMVGGNGDPGAIKAYSQSMAGVSSRRDEMMVATPFCINYSSAWLALQSSKTDTATVPVATAAAVPVLQLLLLLLLLVSSVPVVASRVQEPGAEGDSSEEEPAAAVALPRLTRAESASRVLVVLVECSHRQVTTASASSTTRRPGPLLVTVRGSPTVFKLNQT